MAVAVITCSVGLIGAEAARFFAARGLDIVGIDNDMRCEFFGKEASTIWSRQRPEVELMGYRHRDIDIRDQSAVLSSDPPNGFGFAVRRGLADFQGNAVAIFMADGSDAAADLVAFYHKLQEGYDCVFGSRRPRWPRSGLSGLKTGLEPAGEPVHPAAVSHPLR